MRRLLILSALGLAGILGTTGSAPANGPYYTSAAFPLANPPGYYTNLYSYGWQYPWFSQYNYSSSPYAGWWQNGGYATYRVCGTNPAACPIPGYIGGPQFGGPPFMPGCRNESSHAGGPNGVWLNNGGGYGAPVYGAPAAQVPPVVEKKVEAPVPMPKAEAAPVYDGPVVSGRRFRR